MPNIRSKLHTRFFRRASAASEAPPPPSDLPDQEQQQQDEQQEHSHHHSDPIDPAVGPTDHSSVSSQLAPDTPEDPKPNTILHAVKHDDQPTCPETLGRSESLMSSSLVSYPSQTDAPELVLQEPTPDDTLAPLPSDSKSASPTIERRQLISETNKPSKDGGRKQSLFATVDIDVIRALLQDDNSHPPGPDKPDAHTTMPSAAPAINTGMLHRKIWVKKAGSAATLVEIREDDLVDDVKEAILKKYTNNLGRHYDAPDITLRLVPRDKPGERILNPDEGMCRTLDSFYPGGQSVDEAVVIDVPPKRTPRPSPRGVYVPREPQQIYYYPEEYTSRPHENGTDYFPPMPPAQQSPAAQTNMSHESRHSLTQHSHAAHERAMSVLNTGQVPPLPSPGGTRRLHIAHKPRPLSNRQHASSPTTATPCVTARANRPRLDSRTSDEHVKHIPAAPSLPTPPPADAATVAVMTSTAKPSSNPPTPRVASPRLGPKRKTKLRQPTDPSEAPTTITTTSTTPKPPLGTTASLLNASLTPYIDTSVPPINVLIVEDNHINMKLLEQFIRRLKVRWQTAVNGREAVSKWRQGGFHLVLMDIQLPVMTGIEATKEIRRLERVNGIGVFTHGGCGGADEGESQGMKEEDVLGNKERLFKSPVIIVALTASNLQSDRHEALAAGCNDFLTKPVNFVWFERKVKEWGCMQALIDFDGWRKWKDFDVAPSATPVKKSPAPVKKGAVSPSVAVSKMEQKVEEKLEKEDSPDTVVRVGVGG